MAARARCPPRDRGYRRHARATGRTDGSAGCGSPCSPSPALAARDRVVRPRGAELAYAALPIGQAHPRITCRLSSVATYSIRSRRSCASGCRSRCPAARCRRRRDQRRVVTVSVLASSSAYSRRTTTLSPWNFSASGTARRCRGPAAGCDRACGIGRLWVFASTAKTCRAPDELGLDEPRGARADVALHAAHAGVRAVLVRQRTPAPSPRGRPAAELGRVHDSTPR